MDRVSAEDGGRTIGGDSPFGPAPPRDGALRRAVRSSLVGIAVYYIAILVVAAIMIDQFPVVRRALITPTIPAVAEGAAILGGAPDEWASAPTAALPTSERILTTLLVVCGALALAVPVAWVYMLTKRLRFDPGLVRSVIILPIAVAGILLVVKNSLAIAFSLAGIVAAVRFRNTLKDPRDAVYIFLTIAIGIAAGVQALDVALVVSGMFNLVVFALWRFQVGAPQAGRYGRTGVLSIGDPDLLVGEAPTASESLRRRVLESADGLDVDGVLLVHTAEPEVARHAVLEVLRQNADDWRALPPVNRGAGIVTTQYLVELDRKDDPADLLGELLDWSPRIAAAEYIPFHSRRKSRKKEEASDDDE